MNNYLQQKYRLELKKYRLENSIAMKSCFENIYKWFGEGGTTPKCTLKEKKNEAG